MTSLENVLKKALKQNHLNAFEPHIPTFIHYFQLIQEWNRVINLTTLLTPEQMVYGHLIDSLMIAPYLSGEHFLDVGSGAGLPGIPLAIINPKNNWTLIDKNSKKTRFLTQAVAELNLTQVIVIHDRTEHFQSKEPFDTIVSRALGRLDYFVRSTAHLLHPHGMLVAMKGKIIEEELKNNPNGFVIKDIIPLEITGLGAERHIIRIEKVQPLTV